MILLRTLLLFALIASPTYADTVMMVGFGATSSYPCSHDQLGGTDSTTTNFIRAAGYWYADKITTCTSATRTIGISGDGSTVSDGFKPSRNDVAGTYYYGVNGDWNFDDGSVADHQLKLEFDITSSTAATLTLYIGSVQGTPGTATVRVSTSDTLNLASGYCEASQSITGTGTYTFNLTGCDFED